MDVYIYIDIDIAVDLDSCVSSRGGFNSTPSTCEPLTKLLTQGLQWLFERVGNSFFGVFILGIQFFWVQSPISNTHTPRLHFEQHQPDNLAQRAGFFKLCTLEDFRVFDQLSVLGTNGSLFAVVFFTL